MPKPVEELEKKNLSTEDKILALLHSDPANAYSDIEIMSGVIGGANERAAGIFALGMLLVSDEERMQMQQPFRTALAKLLQEGLIRSFKEGGTIYYASVKK